MRIVAATTGRRALLAGLCVLASALLLAACLPSADETLGDRPSGGSTQPTTPVAEGSSTSPKLLMLEAPWAGSVARDGSGDSFYKMDVLAGRSYTITLTNPTADADLYVFDADSTYTTSTCVSDAVGTANETCTVTASTSVLYFGVDGFYTDTAGAFYTLQVTSPSTVAYSGVEDGTLSEWTTSTNTGTNTYTRSAVSSPTVSGSSYSLRMSGGNGTDGFNGVHRSLSGITPTYIRLYMRTSTSGGQHGNVNITYYDSATTNYISELLVYFNGSTGQLGVYNGSFIPALTYSVDTWYKVEFKNINYSSYTFDFYVDDALVQSSVSFWQTSSYTPTQLDRVYLYNIDNATSYWDELIMMQ